MKKIICALMAAIVCVAFTLSVGANESTQSIGAPSEEIAEATEAVTDVSTSENTGSIEINEALKQASLSEVILIIANELGISVDEAEDLIRNIKNLGDKYFGESNLWVHVTEDMNKNPAKWTLFGLLLLVIAFLIGVLIKKIISETLTNQRIKVAIENIDKGLNGDDTQEGASIREMISEKNGQIELLEEENVELKKKTEELAAVIQALTGAITKMESNSDTSLKITEESALQILQLLNIVLGRKVPVTSKEARQLWYEHTQSKIKTIYEEGQINGEKAVEAQQKV